MKSIPIQDSQIGWRFVDEKYNKLPESDLRTITVYDEASARIFWQDNVSKSSRHIHQGCMQHQMDLIEEFEVDSDEEVDSRELLINKINLEPSTQLFYLNGPDVLMSTSWETFSKYWSDFCYPDDDNIVVIFKDQNTDFIFCEERIFLYKTR